MTNEKNGALSTEETVANMSAASSAEFKRMTIIQTTWNIISHVLIAVITVGYLLSLLGWFNCKTLVHLYGVNDLLADAIAKCPDILFHSTYYSFIATLGVFGYCLFMIARIIMKKDTAQDALSPMLITASVYPWVFPLIHIVADIAGTALKIRSTMMFDVFQLAINGIPLLIITAVSLALLWLNKNVDNL